MPDPGFDPAAEPAAPAPRPGGGAGRGPGQCWNGFCVAGDCDEIHHVDATGSTWTQPRGYVYDPATGRYDLPEHEATGPVRTVYER